MRGLIHFAAWRRLLRPNCKKASEAMNAYSSAIPESTAAEQRAHEPSMEEILASIRKIISEDQSSPLGPLPEFHPPRDEAHTPRAEINAPRAEMNAPRAEMNAPRAEMNAPRLREPEQERMRPPVVSRPPVDFSTAFSAPPPPPSRPLRPEPPRINVEPPAPAKPSADVREFSARAPAPMPRLVTAQDDEPPLLSDQTDVAVNTSFQVLNVARSMPSTQAIESVARDLLRPMLKEWLDDNLPSLVERLVRAEIERVTRSR
jgi:cell pole-organizing protein PopZ